MSTERTEWNDRARGSDLERRFLRIPEVAERLHIGKSTAYEYVREGLLPAIQLRGHGSTLIVAEDELDAFLFAEPEDAA